MADGEPNEPKGGGNEPKGGGGNEPSRTFTQEDVDRIVGDRLKREAEKHSDYDALKDKASKFDELENAKKSEIEKVSGERDSLKGENDKLSTRLLRFEVAAEKGIAPKHAHRLQGSTKEELEKDADELIKELGDKARTPEFNPGAREPANTQDMDSAIRRAAGRA